MVILVYKIHTPAISEAMLGHNAHNACIIHNVLKLHAGTQCTQCLHYSQCTLAGSMASVTLTHRLYIESGR